MQESLASTHFTWALGIEDTCVYPPKRFSMQALDEHELTEHDRNWKTDLQVVRDLGATAVRYGVNWPLVHLGDGEFDWSVLDERLRFAAVDLGLTVIADLVHYGTPVWLSGSFADPRYPEVMADFAGRFAARYRDIVTHVTPLNEPVTTSSFCGLRGVWPPALTGWEGWTRVALNVVEGMRRSIAAMRAANPSVVVVHVEASSLYAAESQHLDSHAAVLESVGTIPTDLLLGMVTREHEMYEWLLAHGADAARLDRLVHDPPRVDVMGVNYYPDLSPRVLVQDGESFSQVVTNRWTEGLAETLRSFADRYDLPLFVTETSIEGDDEMRSAWVESSIEAIGALIAEGLDIRGYTWWPAFDFVDWSYASGGRNIEEFAVDKDIVAARVSRGDDDRAASKSPFLRRMGLIRLDESADGRLVRVRTSAADRFMQYAAQATQVRAGA